MTRRRSATRVRPNVVLPLVSFAAFMAVLDIAIVNVALPSIQGDLRVDQASLQWVVITYGLLFGGFLLLGGRLADLVGRRRVFISGLVLFSAASLLSGLSTNLGTLVVGRGLQGLGAALIAPAALSVLTSTFEEGPERNRALGMYGAMAGIGATAGVIAGGLITSGPGWEWIFFINVPIGTALATLALVFVPRDDAPRVGRSFDIVGAFSVTAGLIVLVYALNGTIDHGWGSQRTIGLLAIAIALLTTFVATELRSPAALMPLRIFRNASVTKANVMAALLFASFVPITFTATLYMQQVLGYSPLRTGLTFLAMSGSAFVSSAVVGSRLVGRFGVRTVLASGLASLALGVVILSRAPVDGGLADLVPAFALIGVGLGSSVVPVQVTAFSGIERHESGLASGLVSTSQEIGGAISIAVIATLSAGRTGEALTAGVAPLEALAAGSRWGFRGASVVAIAGLVAASTLLRRTAPSVPPVPPVAEPSKGKRHRKTTRDPVSTRRVNAMPKAARSQRMTTTRARVRS